MRPSSSAPSGGWCRSQERAGALHRPLTRFLGPPVCRACAAVGHGARSGFERDGPEPGVDWGTAGSQGSKLQGCSKNARVGGSGVSLHIGGASVPGARCRAACTPSSLSLSMLSLSLSSHWHAKFKLQYGRRSSLKQGIHLGLRLPLGRRLVLVGTAAGAVADCCGRGLRCRALAPPLLAGRARRRRFLTGEVRAEGRSFLRQPHGESRACVSTLARCCPAGADANPCPAPTAPGAHTWLPQRHTPKRSCLPRGLPGLNHRLQGARTQTSVCLSGQGAC